MMFQGAAAAQRHSCMTGRCLGELNGPRAQYASAALTFPGSLSCRDQEGRRGSEEAVPGPSVFPSGEGERVLALESREGTRASPEGNTEGPGTASSEPLLPS